MGWLMAAHGSRGCSPETSTLVVVHIMTACETFLKTELIYFRESGSHSASDHPKHTLIELS